MTSCNVASLDPRATERNGGIGELNPSLRAKATTGLWSELVHHPDGWDIPGMFQGVYHDTGQAQIPFVARRLEDEIALGHYGRPK